jgi:hypothetical protein
MHAREEGRMKVSQARLERSDVMTELVDYLVDRKSCARIRSTSALQVQLPVLRYI